MSWPDLVSCFVGGALLANAVPHVTHGVSGKPFQSPFAKPPGKGLSSATVNVLWGAFNLVVAYILLVPVGRFDLHDPAQALAFGFGALASGVGLSRIFGPLHGGR